jgi:hypothetical protein
MSKPLTRIWIIACLLGSLIGLIALLSLEPHSASSGQVIVNAESKVLLGSLKGANFNSTADQSIPMAASKYVIRRITVTNASPSLTLAVGGFYAASGKTTPVVGATQVYSGLTGSTKYLDMTLAAILTTDVRTESTLFFSLTTAQGTGATADLYIFGDVIQ